MKIPIIERDISWLHFNGRVLQEARDWRVPLYDRLKFLAIYSSNLDEFYRVRVASLRSFKKLRKKTRKELLGIKPKKMLKQVRRLVEQQQNLFGQTFREEILPALADEGIFLIDESKLHASQRSFLQGYFSEKIRPLLQPVMLNENEAAPFLENKALYLTILFEGEPDAFALLNIPSGKLPRFIKLPDEEDNHTFIFLDDVIRLNIPNLFPGRTFADAFSIKLSRDAEMYIENEFHGNLVEKIQEALDDRNVGLPTRFLYDARTPAFLIQQFKALWNLNKDDLIPGARYHNFNDFLQFPNPDRADLQEAPLAALPHAGFEQADSLLELIQQKDQLLHFPYQKYDYVPMLIREAVDHPEVEAIKISLYRVSGESEIAKALMYACEQGKEVVVFIEAKARFDEANNLFWGQKLTEKGARVIYSYPEVKVHSKLLLIRTSGRQIAPYLAYIGTGNFNEKTARIYADHALFTAREELAGEVDQVFQLLEGKILIPRPKHLFIAPFTMRDGFTQLLEQEIERAKAGQNAYLILKMNSLEDPSMIEHLYRASRAGVQIDLIVRGICCLCPEREGWSENIRVRSILDRYLEHARLYLFGNGGNEKLFLASADWMTRNLDHRIEVAAPIYDPDLFRELRHLLDLQLRDNVKARRITTEHDNPYWIEPGAKLVRAQMEAYTFIQQKNSKAKTDTRS